MTELLASVQNTDDLRNAVYAGADAVSLHGKGGSFSADALREAVRFCLVRDVHVRYAPEVRSDTAFADAVATAAACGVSVFSVDTPAQARLCRSLVPKCVIHASEAFGVCNLDALRLCEALGIARAAISRQLSQAVASQLLRQSPVSIEVPVFAEGCLCADGTCLLPAVTGRHTPCGTCARPCAKPYSYGRRGEQRPLDAPAVHSIEKAHDWSVLGAAALTVDGGKLTADAVACAKAVLHDGLCTKQTQDRLALLYRGESSPAIQSEFSRVGVQFLLLAEPKQPLRLAALDAQGNQAIVSGEIPSESATPTTRVQWQAILSQTEGTPYRFESLRASVAEGLSPTDDAIGALRRTVLSKLTALRSRIPDVTLGSAPIYPPSSPTHEAPVWTVAVHNAMQITPELLAFKPAMIYLPLSEFAKLPSSLRRFPVSTTPCVICPRVLSEEDYATAERKLRALKADGIIDALCADYGQYALLRKLGFVIHWDVPRGVTDNGDVHFLSDGKVATAACSLTLSMAQIRRLEKPIPLETVVYGRIPLLLSHTCLIRARSGVCACDGATVKMTDRSGEDHPLLTECGTCRNVVYSGKKLYLLDKQADLARLGLWAYRLQFTTEHPNEIDILLRKLHRSAPFDAVACTRGLYPNGLSDRLQ